MEADVPPDVRVVGDAARLLELADHLRVVGVVAEARRRPRAGEGGEDDLPARRETGVAISSTDCISSALICVSSSCPEIAASTVSMCWTRSNVSPSRSMYSSSTPSVYGSPLPKRWSRTLPPAAKPLAVIEAG